MLYILLPSILVSLIPANDRAKDIINYLENYYLMGRIPEAYNPLNPAEIAHGLNIGLYISSKSSHTLVSLG